MKKSKDAPDLMGALPVKRKRGRPRKKPTPTAEQIAISCEKEAQKWLDIAQTLRGQEKK